MGTNAELQSAEPKPAGPDGAIPRAIRAYRRQPRHVWVSFLTGCLLAVIFMELVLHNFSGKSENAAGFEERDYREGFAKAHFSSDGLRLTANPQIAGTPCVLIIGDSHVEAYSVSDQQTMGSILERRLRAEGKNWNVLQYGWRGADGPDYVYQANLVMGRFHPKWIFLVATKGDFDTTSTGYARLAERDGSVVAEPAQPGIQPGRPPSYGSSLAKRFKESGLLYAAVVRLHLEVLPNLMPGPHEQKREDAGQTPEQATKQIVRGLKVGYGDKLFVLYAPEQMFSADAPVEREETSLLVACKQYGLACRTLRERMIEDLLMNHKLDRGESNTAPGWGHFNANGHELVADEIATWLDSLR
jgi:hypothetical protein